MSWSQKPAILRQNWSVRAGHHLDHLQSHCWKCLQACPDAEVYRSMAAQRTLLKDHNTWYLLWILLGHEEHLLYLKPTGNVKITGEKSKESWRCNAGRKLAYLVVCSSLDQCCDTHRCYLQLYGEYHMHGSAASASAAQMPS